MSELADTSGKSARYQMVPRPTQVRKANADLCICLHSAVLPPCLQKGLKIQQAIERGPVRCVSARFDCCRGARHCLVSRCMCRATGRAARPPPLTPRPPHNPHNHHPPPPPPPFVKRGVTEGQEVGL